MKVNFGQTNWSDLLEIRDAVRNERTSFVTREAAELLMKGLANAIDAEFKRMRLNGEVPAGTMIMSVDLKIEPDLLSKGGLPVAKSLLQELDDELNKGPRVKKKSLLTY